MIVNTTKIPKFQCLHVLTGTVPSQLGFRTSVDRSVHVEFSDSTGETKLIEYIG